MRGVASFLAKSVQTKKSFIVYCVVAIGIPYSGVLLWIFGSLGDPIWKAYLIVLGLLFGLLTGVAGWHFYAKGFVERIRREREQAETRKASLS